MSKYDDLYEEAGRHHNVDPALMKAIAIQESGEDPTRTGRSGEWGMMQFMPATARQYGLTREQAYNSPRDAIFAAAHYMSDNLDRFTERSGRVNLPAAVAAYNGSGQAAQNYAATVIPIYRKVAATGRAPSNDAIIADAVARARGDQAGHGGTSAGGAGDPDVAAGMDALNAAAGGKPADRTTQHDTSSDDDVKAGMAVLDAARKTEPPKIEPAAKPQSTPAVDDLGRPIPGTGGTDTPLAGQDAANRIIGAGVEGWRNTEPALTPLGEQAVGPVASFVSSALVDNPRRALNALMGGGSQAIMEVTTPLGPEAYGARLGRDINQLIQVAPAAEMGRFSPRMSPDEIRLQRRVADIAAEGGARGEASANALRPGDAARPAPAETGAAQGGGPQPGMGAVPALAPEDAQWVSGAKARLDEIHAENRAAGVPGSVGAAATPEELAKLTPAQMKAYRRQAELGDIVAPPERGVDTKIHVEGSEPTHAEWAGDPAVSQQETLLRQRAPKDYDERLVKNNQARVNSYESMMGTDPQVVGVREAKAKAAERDGAAFVRAAGPIDLQPALSWVDEQLASPRILEQPEIVKTLRQMRESLFDADGKLKTDPQSGWGMHDQNMTRLEKSKLDTKDERFATSQILQFKRLVDDANNKASNGAFQTFLDNQASYAQQINAMTELQKFRTRLTNNKGEINAPAFHKFVTDLAMRRGKAGVDAAMDISDATMRGLINIDRDLKRASNIDLGKARGSGTNLFFALAQQMGLGAAHLGMAAATTGPVGNLLLQGAANTVGKLTGSALLNRKVRKGLAPPPGGYTYNALGPD